MRKVELTLIICLCISLSIYLFQQIATAQIPKAPSQNNTSSALAPFTTYDNSTFGIKIDYPSHWKKVENVGRLLGHTIVVEFYSVDLKNASKLFSENLNIVVGNLIPKNMSLAEYSNISINELKKIFPGLIMEEQTPITLSGNPALNVVYSFKQGQFKFKQMQIWTLKDGSDYVITYSAQPAEYSNLSIAQKIINSFSTKIVK
jgi:eukaryotic-like serine/threonine-protein kinase